MVPKITKMAKEWDHQGIGVGRMGPGSMVLRFEK
jgi:hypothetical protein